MGVCLHVCLHNMCFLDEFRCQKMLDFLGLELQTGMRPHVDARNWIWVL